MRLSNTVPLVAAALSLATASAAGAELAHGPWSVRYSESGIRAVSHRGVTILTQGSFTAFEPSYKGHTFSMARARVAERAEAGARVVEWAKEETGKARVTMTLRLEEDRLEWSARMRVWVDGPVEMGILVPPAAIAGPTGAILCQIGNDQVEIHEAQFPTRVLTGPITLDTPPREWRFDTTASAGRWLFQDRRLAQKHLRVIACLRAAGREPLDAHVSLRLSVRSFEGSARTGREKLMAQRSRTYVPVPVENWDFESDPPLSAWTHGPNSAVVDEGPAPGRRCAKIVVENRDERGVYLTQRVPVQPGRRYRARAAVRTEGVRQATVLGMKSVGAVLIVEWADQDGKWLAPGRYAKGAFGTKGWHVQSADDVGAPEKARYAVIFLGLRGLGTAWFDNVELFEVRRAAVLLAPLDLGELADNRPRLEWRPDPSAKRYRVEISSTPAFAEGTLAVAAETDEPVFVPKQKLAPARWHWRVWLDREPPATAWSFVQTAAQDADTTGPAISAPARSFTQPQEPLGVTTDDESEIDHRSFELFVDGQREPSAQIVGAETQWGVRPVPGWPTGAHEVTVRLADSKGNVGQATTWIVHGPRAARPIAWTRDRGLRVGERYEFPLGIYQVRTEDLARVKDAGFDLVHIYTWEGSQDHAAARQYLDAVHAAGLRAFVGFDRGNASGRGLVQGNFGMVARRIAALRDHPGLGAWYLFDEPDLLHQYVPPKLLRQYYEFIQALDPDHPVIVTLATRGAIEKYGKCWDVYWSMVYRDTAFVADRLAEHRGMLGRECPHMSIVHSYDRAQTSKMKAGEPIDESEFWPDYRTLRANALVSLVRGTSGLVWWWFGDHKRQWLATPDVPEMWDAHRRVVAELRRLEPMLVAPGRDEAVAVACTPPEAAVHARLKALDAGVLLIAVNASEHRATARITSPALRAGLRLRVLGEGRTVTARGGEVLDEFGPLAVHVYQSE